MLEKDASKRLGTSGCPYGEICDQPFFKSIHWDRLERKELDPPFKPRVVRNLFFVFFFIAENYTDFYKVKRVMKYLVQCEVFRDVCSEFDA